MLLNSWSITLLICSTGTLFIIGLASFTAIKVLIYWDSSSDSEKQIELEGQTWLSAALVQYGLVIQLISLILLVMAAEDISEMIAGAMCATGSFLANDYGTKVLYLKIAGIFFYGFWIVLHRLDMHSEYYPLIRIKYIYLVALLPILLLDSYWLVNYLVKLEPDIITSCCGVIFANKNLKGNFITLAFSPITLVPVFYISTVVLMISGFFLRKIVTINDPYRKMFSHVAYSVGWICLFPLSLVVITTFFSSYIYAMPSHNCPFDMLKSQYLGIGYPIYLSLFGATFLAVSSGLTELLRHKPGLSAPVHSYQKFAVGTSLWLLFIFVALVTYPVCAYLLAGGES
jgi:hypothetical protein